MILKIVKIKNIGKFEDCNASPEFRRKTLIFADNARGKTTFSEIIRSLAEQKPEIINRRKSVNSTGYPQVELCTKNNVVAFQNGKWQAKYTEGDIYVFNSKFVEENVISGFQIKKGHGVSLYDFACGPNALSLSDKIIENKKDTDSIRESDLIPAKDFLENKIEPHFNIEDYIDLDFDVDSVEKELRKEQSLFKRAMNSQKIKNGEELRELARIKLEFDIQEAQKVLEKTIYDIQPKAIKLVRDKKTNLNDPEAEKWLEWGHQHIKDEICPFCNQSVQGFEIVKAYGDYFSGLVKKLIRDVDVLKKDIQISNNQLVKNSNFSLMERNKAFYKNLWKEYLENQHDFKNISDMNNLNKYLGDLLDKITDKQESIVDKVECSEIVEKIDSFITTYNKCVSDYNKEVKSVNEAIKRIKRNVPDKEKKKRVINKLNVKLMREEKEIKKACKKFKEATNKIETNKKELKELYMKRNKETQNILERYSKLINGLLDDFGSEVKINKDTVTATNPGGARQTSVIYTLELHGRKVDPRNVRDDELWLEDVLSDGDKTAFGFSFFLSRVLLLKDKELKKSTIVIDDPISSFDEHRRDKTLGYIKTLTNKCKQVIVLSHNRSFLKNLHERITQTNSSEVTFGKIVNGNIADWNANKDWQTKELKLIGKLEKYLEKGCGSYEDIRRTIRPVIEYNLKFRFKDLRQYRSLGKMLGFVRDTDFNLFSEEEYEFLDQKNDFSSEEGHHSGVNLNNRTELEREVKETLKYINNPKSVLKRP